MPHHRQSCLIKRYCEGRFVSRYMATVGLDFGVTTYVTSRPPPSTQTSTATSALVPLPPASLYQQPRTLALPSPFVISPTLLPCRPRLQLNDCDVKANLYDLSGDNVYLETRVEFYEDVQVGHEECAAAHETSRAWRRSNGSDSACPAHSRPSPGPAAGV